MVGIRFGSAMAKSQFKARGIQYMAWRLFGVR